MPTILDPTAWAVRPECMAVVRRFLRADISPAEVRQLIDDPQAAEARVRQAATVDPEDLTRVGSVAILSLTGIIQPNASLLSLLLFGGGGSLQQFRAELRAALNDDSVSAIVLHIDSPGGRTSLVEETAAELLAARDRKPIVAVANTMAASAAYWIASQATELVVTPSGYVGSIGVYMLHNDWSGWNEQQGIIPTYVFAAPYKVEGNPDEPLSDEAKADWQRDVDAIYERFLAAVAAGRGASVDTVRSDYGQGRVLNASDALAAGMVNRIATFEETVEALVQRTTTSLPDQGSRAQRLAAGEPVDGATFADVVEARAILELPALTDDQVAAARAQVEADPSTASEWIKPLEDDPPDDQSDPAALTAADEFDALAL